MPPGKLFSHAAIPGVISMFIYSIIRLLLCWEQQP